MEDIAIMRNQNGYRLLRKFRSTMFVQCFRIAHGTLPPSIRFQCISVEVSHIPLVIYVLDLRRTLRRVCSVFSVGRLVQPRSRAISAIERIVGAVGLTDAAT